MRIYLLLVTILTCLAPISTAETITFRKPPQALSASKQKELNRLQERLREVTRLHHPDISEAQRKTLEKEARSLIKQIDPLLKEQRSWALHQAMQNNKPQQKTITSSSFDWRRLMKDWNHYRRLTRATTEPTIKEWRDLMRTLDRYQNIPLTLSQADPTRFILRTIYFQGHCQTNLAKIYWRRGDKTNHRYFYEQSLGTYQRLLEILHQAQQQGHFKKVDSISFHLYTWLEEQKLMYLLQDQQYRGLIYGPGKQKSFDLEVEDLSHHITQALAESCPWGVNLYYALKDMDILRNFDFNMLPAFHNPSLIEYAPKLQVRTLPESEVPYHIIEDMRTLTGPDSSMAGRIDLQNNLSIPVQWQVLTPPTYSLWILGPSIYNIKPSEVTSILDNIRDLVFALDPKDAYYGAKGYALDLSVKEIPHRTKQFFGSDGKLYGTMSDLQTAYEAGIDKDLIVDFAEAGFNWTKLVSSLANVAFQYMDEQELEMLFEGLDPEAAQISRHQGFRDSPIPPIIIRAEVFGFEVTKPHEYQRSHRVMRYYLLDYGYLTGLAKRYQLNELAATQADPMPTANDYLAGKKTSVRHTWPLVPHQDNQAFGVRDHLINFTPKAQVLCLKINPELYQTWQQEAKAQKTVPEVRFYDVQEKHKPADQRADFIRAELKRPTLICQFYHRPYFPAEDPRYKEGWPEHTLAGASGLWQAIGRIAPAPGRSEAPSSLGSGGILGDTSITTGIKSTVHTSHFKEGSLSYKNMRTQGWRWENGYMYRDLERNYLAEVRIGDQIKAEIPIAFVGGKDQDITGKVTWPVNHFCILDQTYPEVRNKPIPLKANTKDLLSPRIRIVKAVTDRSFSTQFDSPQEYSLSADFIRHILLKNIKTTPSIILKGTMSGFPLKPGYHKVTITLAKQQFFAWCHIPYRYASGHFECSLAVPTGTHEVTVTCPGVRPYQFTITRPASPTSSKELVSHQRNYQEELGRYRKDRSADRANSLAYDSARIAEALHELGRAEEAHPYFKQAKKLYHNSTMGSYALEAFMETSFHTRDLDNLLWAGQAYIQANNGKNALKTYREKGRGHKSTKLDAAEAAEDYERLIRYWLALGGSTNVAEQLYHRIMKLYAMAGFPRGHWRSELPEVTVCFGPPSK